MDIQYNDGPQAVRYLAKYLAKDDYEAKILLKNIQAQNQGYYKRTTYVSEREHYSTRIVGAVEATYDIMGWRKHSNSRNVIFLSTSLLGQDTRRLRDDIKDLAEDDDQIFSLTPVGNFFESSVFHAFFFLFLIFTNRNIRKKERCSRVDYATVLLFL